MVWEVTAEGVQERAVLAGRDEKKRLRDIGRLLGGLLGRCEIRRDCVLANVPPAWVHHVRLPGYVAVEQPAPLAVLG